MSQLPHRRIINSPICEVKMGSLRGNKGGTVFELPQIENPFFGSGQHNYCYHNNVFIMMHTNALIS